MNFDCSDDEFAADRRLLALLRTAALARGGELPARVAELDAAVSAAQERLTYLRQCLDRAKLDGPDEELIVHLPHRTALFLRDAAHVYGSTMECLAAKVIVEWLQYNGLHRASD